MTRVAGPPPRDLWLNECLICGTHNPGLMTTPKTCSGCGRPLRPLRPVVEAGFWGQRDGYSDERYRKRGRR